MSQPQPSLPPFLGLLFQRLRRRGFVIGLEDYEALRQSLWAGFGWSSQDDLRSLCAALWAKSHKEQKILFALFNQLAPESEDWKLSNQETDSDDSTDAMSDYKSDHNKEDTLELKETQQETPKIKAQPGLPRISLTNVKVAERPFVFVPQFPLTYREVAQAWRRLRRPVRIGPAIELDIDGTISRRYRQGIACSMVLRPRRCNVARLLLLVDRQGSMNPFHRFCEEVCTAIQQSGRLEDKAVYYFHNSPAEGADEQVLEFLEGKLFPSLDPILSQINPLTQGDLYADPELLYLQPLEKVLKAHATNASVVIISDAGAARGRYRMSRLLDTIAFFKGLRTYTTHYVWLNPLPKRYWAKSTAANIARHIPMFPLDREGMYKAVNVLRGQQHTIEKPL